MAIELFRIWTTHQYPMFMPTLYPAELGTRKRPYDSLASMWTVVTNKSQNTIPAIDGDAFASASQASSSHAPFNKVLAAPTVSTLRRPWRPASHDISSVSFAHSRRDQLSIDYGLCPFDYKDYAFVCTAPNLMVHTDLSLWTPLITDEAQPQACVQYHDRCCKCGSTKHSLRWCSVCFQNVFSLLNPEFTTHDPDGSVFGT